MAEEALNESRKLIDHVMLYTPDLIIVTDAETNLVLYTNRNLFEGVDRSGYTSEKLFRLNVWELMRLFLNPKDWPSFREFIESLRSLDDDDIIQLEYCAQTHDAKWEWFVTRSKVFKRDPEGRAREIISFTNSIDRKKHSDETITHLTEVLINKNEKLESLNSELKTLSNIAAHDYIDTLRSTYTQLEYIILNDARNLSDAGKASIRRSQSGIQKMKLLTEDLVAYTQIPFLEDQVSPVDLNEVLRNVLDNMSKKIYETEASIVCDRLPTIPGISNLFFLLFYHLIDNSIKFKRKSDKPFIQITHKQVDRIPGKTSLSNGIYDTVTVTDNGIGFEKKDAESIFIIFHRLHDKFKYKGSGIGLAICKKIMEVQNGFIIASSVPGKGASFNCFFQQIKEANYVSFL
jgi:signal transduction histidine kinase